MRKIKWAMALIPIFFFTACSSHQPSSVAKKFVNALYTADFKGAKALCTENSKQAVDFVAAFASQSIAKMKKANVDYEVQNVKLSEDGNSADIEGLVKGSIDLQNNAVKDPVDLKLHLIKSDDRWLVDYKLK